MRSYTRWGWTARPVGKTSFIDSNDYLTLFVERTRKRARREARKMQVAGRGKYVAVKIQVTVTEL
jgi:hypothetical protein